MSVRSLALGLLLVAGLLQAEGRAAEAPADSFEVFLRQLRAQCLDADADGVCDFEDEPGAAEAAPSLLVLGLDGVNWEVLDPLMAAGYLPTLHGLVESGARARIDCLPAAPTSRSACFDPPVWNSLVTGQPAAVHRVRSLGTPPSERRAPAIWSVLHAHGGRAGVANYRNSWPPEEELAWVLTEPGIAWASSAIFEPWPARRNAEHGTAEDRTRPPGLFETLGLLPHEGRRLPAWRSVASDRVTMRAALRAELDELYRHPERLRRPYLVMIHLGSTDLAGHYTWHTIQPSPEDPIDREALLAQAAAWKGPSHLPGPHGYETVSQRLLEIDRWLGVLLEYVPYDSVVVHSDHGMGRARRPEALPGNHAVRAVPESRYGVFVVKGPGVVAGRKLETISVLDLAPTLAYLLGLPVAVDLPGRVVSEAFGDAHRSRHPPKSVPSW